MAEQAGRGEEQDEDLALEIITFLDPEAVEDFKAWRREPRRRTAAASSMAWSTRIFRSI